MKQYIEKSKLTQQKLAATLCISSRTVGRYVNDETVPQDYQIVIAICIVLKLSERQAYNLMDAAGFSIGTVKTNDYEKALHYTALANTSLRDLMGWNEYFEACGVSGLITNMYSSKF